jgi:hypothetical protein
MALVTEDGTGLPNAESYASVADADTYWSGRGAPSAWTGLATDSKEAALRLGTEYLGQQYAGLWQGDRLTSTQALDWPRAGLVLDNISQASNVVPVALKRATIELALKSRTSSLMADETAQVKSEAVGPIEVVYADGERQQTRFASVEAMVRPLLKGGAQGSIRIVRA